MVDLLSYFTTPNHTLLSKVRKDGVILLTVQRETQLKHTIVFIMEDCLEKGDYPYERVLILAQLLKQHDVHLFVRSATPVKLSLFSQMGLTPITFNDYRQLAQQLKTLQSDLVIRDGKDSEREQIEIIRPFCKTLIHFDDYGSGNPFADAVLFSLYPEVRDTFSEKMVYGHTAFIVPKDWPQPTEHDNLNIHDLPHIVVVFEDGDDNNLTYRTLRHLTQLHIPLQISIVLDANYKHSTEDLQMMVLSRRNIHICRKHGALANILPTADITICNANYTPYKIAAYGVPCITLAQHERELQYAFPREQNGFIHLGLGRKIKQSHIQNAVMELVLHETRRERAVQKQRKLALQHNQDILVQQLLDYVDVHCNVTMS